MIVQYEINIPGSSITEKLNSTMSVAPAQLLEQFHLNIFSNQFNKFNIFELGIFSFNSYVYSLRRSFIASTRTFNLPTRDFNLAARVFSPLTRRFEAITRGFELVTREFELVTRNL